jgi:hypothetical protein
MSEPYDNPGSAPIDLVPTLRRLVDADGLDPAGLSIAFEKEAERKIRVMDKHVVLVTDGDKVVDWPVASLAELFRGDKLPPPDMEHYPAEYAEHFFFIEHQVMILNDIMGD